MDRTDALLASPATLLAALVWSPITGFPTWGTLSRERYGSTVALSVAVAAVVFTLVQRLTAPAAT